MMASKQDIVFVYNQVRSTYLQIIALIDHEKAKYPHNKIIYVHLSNVLKSIMLDTLKKDRKQLIKAFKCGCLQQELEAVLYELDVFYHSIIDILGELADGQDMSEIIYLLNEQSPNIADRLSNRFRDISEFVDIKQTVNRIASPIKILLESSLEMLFRKGNV